MSKLPDDDSGGILMPILVTLLVLVGLGTAGAFAYIGMHSAAYQSEEPSSSSVAQPQEQPQKSGKASSFSGGVTYIDGVRVTQENDDTEGQTQVIDDSSDVQASSSEPSAPEAPATVPEEKNKPSESTKPQNTPAQNQGKAQTGTQNKGTDASGGKTQTGVNINPSSPATNKPQNGGANTGTQSGEDVSSNFAAGKVLVTSASDNNNDPVYHTKYCRSAQKIDQNDMRWYDSAQEAEDDGRRICGNCKK